MITLYNAVSRTVQTHISCTGNGTVQRAIEHLEALYMPIFTTQNVKTMKIREAVREPLELTTQLHPADVELT